MITLHIRYLYQQKLINHFWQRWWGEYLQQLSVRQKWVNEQPALKIGDVVLISEGNVSRGKWPMGRVDRLLPGKHGLIRYLEDEEGASKETCFEATSFGSKQYSVC